jgi:hypothetical protein
MRFPLAEQVDLIEGFPSMSEEQEPKEAAAKIVVPDEITFDYVKGRRTNI